VEEKKLVVVADVPVALMNVKFCRVLEPVARMLPAVRRPERVCVLPEESVK
jgi:hypothetical protein